MSDFKKRMGQFFFFGQKCYFGSLLLNTKRHFQKEKNVNRNGPRHQPAFTILLTPLFSHCTMQCCGSGMFIPDREGWKQICCHTFFVATNFTKFQILFIFELLNKIWANFQRVIELFIQKIVTKLSEIWGWDPGSGKNLSRIPDQGWKRHRIPDPDPQHWYNVRGELGNKCAEHHNLKTVKIRDIVWKQIIQRILFCT